MSAHSRANGVFIRPALDTDLPGLEWDGEYTRYRQVYRQTYADTERGARIMLVAVAEGAVVGQVFVQLASAETRYADGARRAYLYALRVRPGWRGQGLGTSLVEAAEDALLARGFATAVIAVGKDNLGARRLYERLGYAVFAEDPGVWYFTDVNGQQQLVEEPCWVMQKELAA
jgi:ribosomal protein S18 acetylase RimI-like enzyme